MSLGSNIYSLRTARGMSQGDVADALEVSRQSVSKWETDTSIPDLDKLVKLSILFEVTLDQLVNGLKPAESPLPAREPEPQQAPSISVKNTGVALPLSFTIPFWIYVPLMILDPACWLIGGDFALAYIWFIFPLIGLIFCCYFAARFSPKWTWLIALASWVAESASIRPAFDLLGVLDGPTLLGPMVGYAFGLIIYLVRAFFRN